MLTVPEFMIAPPLNRRSVPPPLANKVPVLLTVPLLPIFTSSVPPPLASRVPLLLSVRPGETAMTPVPGAKLPMVPALVLVPVIWSVAVAGTANVPALVAPLNLARKPGITSTTPVPAVAIVPPLTVVPLKRRMREPFSAVMVPELLLIVPPPIPPPPTFPFTSSVPPPLACRVPVLFSVIPLEMEITPNPGPKMPMVPVFVLVPVIPSTEAGCEVPGIANVPVLVTPLKLTIKPLIPTTPEPAVANVPPLTVVIKPEITTREPSSAVMTPELLLIVAPPPFTSSVPPPLACRVPVLLSVCPAAIVMTPAPAAKLPIVPVFVLVRQYGAQTWQVSRRCRCWSRRSR